MAEALLPPASRTIRPRVNTSKFMGSSFAAGSALEDRVGNNERKITVLKNILKIRKSNIAENLQPSSQGPIEGISASLDSIIETLKEDHKLKEDIAEDAKKEAEDKKRSLKERLLEGAGNIWEGAKEIGAKILSPFAKYWETIKNFIATLILGNVITRLVKWFTNPQNQDKIKNIVRFLKDWWPTMLAAYLLFGNSFVKMAIKLVANIGKFTLSFLKLIPKLVAAIAKLKIGKILKMIPGGRSGLISKAAMPLMSLGLPMMVEGVMGSGEEIGDSESEFLGLDDRKGGSEETSSGDQRGGFFGRFFGRREETPKVQKKAQGGFVSGPEGRDRVPAKLTAGEFVMSKGAVNKWGVDTLAGMNAAGGGTNISVGNRYEGGGVVMNAAGNRYEGGGVVLTPTPEEQKRIERGSLKTPIVKPGSINSYKDAVDAGIVIVDKHYGDLRHYTMPGFTIRMPKTEDGKERWKKVGKKSGTISQVGGGAAETMAMSTSEFINSNVDWAAINSFPQSFAKKLGFDPKNIVGAAGIAGQGGREFTKKEAFSNNKKESNITPSPRKDPSTVVADMRRQKAAQQSSRKKLTQGADIPPFSASAKRSAAKMEVLGITV